MAMSASAVEKPTQASTVRPPGEVADRLRRAQITNPGVDRQLHAQDNDRVYQAAGDQYIFDHALPATAAARNTLPRDVAAFTGRSDEVDALIARVTELVAARDFIPVLAISGMPGVGKTTFAIHAAHRLAAKFPDGQMFVDLRAHTAGKAPADPSEALFALLSVEGVPTQEIPDDVDGRAALWRARMAGRRSILILDNAASLAPSVRVAVAAG